MADENRRPHDQPKLAPVPEPLPNPAPSGNTPTVHVACKLPNGLVLQLQKRADDDKTSIAVGDQIVLKGAQQAHLIGGYGITEVAADFWEAWLKQNQEYGPVRLGLIFAEGSRERAEAKAKERKHVLTGLEGIPPERLGPGLEPVPEK
jgi:hypothetical protein